ncbi:MAG: PaaI family thioesterase [Desulfosudaceae bacterium]
MAEHAPFDPETRSLIEETMKTRSPYWNLLGIELVDIRKGWSRLRLPFDPKLTHPFGIAHGGSIFPVADSAVAMALIGLVSPEETFVTIEMNIKYLAAFTEGEIVAEAQILHKGRNTALGEITVTGNNDRLVARASATYLIMPAHDRVKNMNDLSSS